MTLANGRIVWFYSAAESRRCGILSFGKAGSPRVQWEIAVVAQSRLSLADFSSVIEDIYDCALNSENWRSVLPRIAELIDSPKITMGITDYAVTREVRLYQHGFDERYVKLYFEKYAAANPVFIAGHTRPVGDVYTTGMVVDRQEFFESRFYREWAQPQRLHDTISVHALKSGRRNAGITALRHDDQPLYQEQDIEIYRLLAPHICRAFAISDALDLKTITSQVLEATLDALTSGVYLTGFDGRIVYMNRAAEQQIRSANTLRIVNHRLEPLNPEARATMAHAISSAISDEASMPVGGFTLALPASDNTGLVATVLPLDRGQRRTVSGPFAAAAAIFVQDPLTVPVLPGVALAKIYGLTPAEMRVLLAMSPGLAIKEAADILGIGENTAKTHLQRIFSKTGTSKQAELMILLRNSVPPVSAA
jgi:DNA-binding CsgD family transcriptional regulator/PAS domain-containing protein